MFKKIFRPIYIPIFFFLKQYKYFILPNIFNKTRYYIASKPNFNQLTLFTGKGSITIGNNCIFGYKLGGFWRNGSIELQSRIENAKIIIGDNVSTNNNIFICAMNKIEINDNVRIGQNVIIMDFEAHNTNPLKRNKIGEIGNVIIEENVWIGNNVTILKNSSIGKNTIIAAGAIVNGHFPENVIIGGVPCKILKNLNFE